MPIFNFVISTDNTCDFPENFYEQHGVPCLHIDYTIDEICYDGSIEGLSPKVFYDRIRAGSMPITQQANPEKSREFFEKILKDGKDILHIAFSSGLSGTYQSNRMAAQELAEEYPERKIVILDSLCASAGEGLLVFEALKRRDEGMSMEEITAWVENNKLRLVHDVVADDLFHLQRGGRVSKTAAIFGSALGIKPQIHVDNEGHLIPFGKIRGKKAGLLSMADRLAKNLEPTDTIFVSHSDSLEDAEALCQMIKERTGHDKFQISYIGPTIGAHTGVGTVALFYFAKDRTPA